MINAEKLTPAIFKVMAHQTTEDTLESMIRKLVVSVVASQLPPQQSAIFYHLTKDAQSSGEISKKLGTTASNGVSTQLELMVKNYPTIIEKQIIEQYGYKVCLWKLI